jgi:hypothetical protein
MVPKLPDRVSQAGRRLGVKRLTGDKFVLYRPSAAPVQATAGSAHKPVACVLAVPPSLTAHQRLEALQRLAAGETQTDIARSYNVSHVTIGRLQPRPYPAGGAGLPA